VGVGGRRWLCGQCRTIKAEGSRSLEMSSLRREDKGVLASQQWKESGEMGVDDLERIQSGR
jgi:hypothetical protein